MKHLVEACILTAMIVFAFPLAMKAGINLNFYRDYCKIRVSGPSMLETLKSGELTLCYSPYPFKSLRRFDIVIIDSERGFSVIHRIVRRYRGGLWVTKGDNNEKEDRELLGPDNFSGLVLVDSSSIKHFQTYLNSIGERPAADVVSYIVKQQNKG